MTPAPAQTLDIALKEWSIVCDLLLEGKLALLLRKGGIHESGGPGVFELEHNRFLLFPSWAHQKPTMVKEEFRGRVLVQSEPASITFQGLAQVGKIWRVPNRAAVEKLDPFHCWTAEHLDMRFNYKPEHPLYLLALRAYRLAAPKTIPNRPAYAGCKSWVSLEPADAVDVGQAIPMVDDQAFAALINQVDSTLT